MKCKTMVNSETMLGNSSSSGWNVKIRSQPGGIDHVLHSNKSSGPKGLSAGAAACVYYVYSFIYLFWPTEDVNCSMLFAQKHMRKRGGWEMLREQQEEGQTDKRWRLSSNKGLVPTWVTHLSLHPATVKQAAARLVWPPDLLEPFCVPDVKAQH